MEVSIEVPSYDQIMWPTLLALKELGGSATISDLNSRTAEIMELSEEVLSVPHTSKNSTSFDYRCAWARTYLKFISAVENNKRAVWSITKFGSNLANEEETRKLVREYRIQMRSERAGVEKNKSNNTEKTKPLNVLFTIFIIILVLVSLVLLVISKKLENKILKEELQSSIITVANNDGNLDIIKHVYLKRKPFDGIFKYYSKLNTLPDLYESNTPLSMVLEDIRTDIYSNKDGKIDANLLVKIENLIIDHQQLDPFDKLDENQRDNFRNIRLKLGDNYSIVQIETNKIADELNIQNLLVQKYLADSKLSLIVSWIALGLTFILGSVQIYQGTKINRVMTSYSVATLADANATLDDEVEEEIIETNAADEEDLKEE